jgi:hypothetical protein
MKRPGSRFGHLLNQRPHLMACAVCPLFCRSLLAGDSARPLTDGTLNRLQAGSYMRIKAAPTSGHRGCRK